MTNSNYEKKPCQVKVCKKLSPCQLEISNNKNSAAKGLNIGIIFIELKVGTAHWKSYWLTVVIRGAESQEGGGIARVWITDPKVYHGISMPQ